MKIYYNNYISTKALINNVSVIDFYLSRIKTISVDNIKHSSVNAQGFIYSYCQNIIERGFCWSLNENPTKLDNYIISTGTTGFYSSYISGLSYDTNYYIRSYMINSNNITNYGKTISFKTILPTAPISTIESVINTETSSNVLIKVENFSGITDCLLTINYDENIINIKNVTPVSGLPGIFIKNISQSGKIIITWFTWPGVRLQDNSTIFILNFDKVSNGTSEIIFNSDTDISCYWGDDQSIVRDQQPFSTYYINGSLTFE
jgi:hypothetical protein